MDTNQFPKLRAMTWSRWLRKFRWAGTLLWILAAACIPGTIQASNPIHAVVGIEAHIPFSARTAGILGTDRRGSGVLIDKEGLVVTIGYLILEAEEVQLIDKVISKDSYEHYRLSHIY